MEVQTKSEDFRQADLGLGFGSRETSGEGSFATRNGKPVERTGNSSGRAIMECRDNIEFMRDLPAGSMKLIVTSPPYNIGKLSGNPKGKNPSDVWMFPNVKSNHVEKTIHPCQFPVELVERLVLSMTNPGDSVLDPYMGVGSSVVAALMHGRSGYGCDTVEEYVDIAWERVNALEDGALRTRPMGKPVYDPTKPNGGH